jgi:NAD-dependent dihydropyrimidine dehydrogenase PreA subunit
MIKIVNIEKCDGCGACVNGCPTQVLGIENGKVALVDAFYCTDCGLCREACQYLILQPGNELQKQG